MTDFSDIKVGDKVLVDGARAAIGGNSQDGYGGFATPWSKEKEDIVKLKANICWYYSKIIENCPRVWKIYGKDEIAKQKKKMKAVHAMAASCLSDIDELLGKMESK